MNFYSILPLLTSLIVIFCGIFVLSQNKNSLNTKLFFLFSLTGFWWQFSWFILFNLKDENLGYLVAKIGYSGIIFIPITYLHFVTSIIKFRNKLIIILSYIFAFLLLLSIWTTKYFVSGLYSYFWGFYPKVGILHLLHILQTSICALIVIYLLKKESKIEKNSLKYNQIKYLLLAAISYCFCATDYIVNYGIEFYPFGFIFEILSYIVFGYATIKYRLMDISIAIKKTSMLALSIGLPVGIYFLIINLLQPRLIKILGNYWWVSISFSSFLVAFFIYKRIRYILKLKDEELEKEKYHYRSTLRKYAEDITKGKTFDEVATYIVRRITSIGKINFCALARLKQEIQNEKTKNYYEIVKVADRTAKHLRYLEKTRIEEEIPIIQHMKNTKNYVEKEYLKYLINTGKNINKWYYIQVIKDLETFHSELAIPAFNENDLYGFLFLGNKLNNSYYTKEDIELFKVLAMQTTKSIIEVIQREEKIRLILASCSATLAALDGKDHYTRGHTERVKEYCKSLAKNKEISNELNRIKEGVWGLELAAELHDIGKISIPDNILNKPENLTYEEYEKIRNHPKEAIKILEPLKIWLKENIINGIIQHHENYDGSGYPFGLKAKEIHIYARIIRVADAVDAMLTERPYRKPLSYDQIKEELLKYRGTWFDTTITDVFLKECIPTAKYIYISSPEQIKKEKKKYLKRELPGLKTSPYLTD